FSHKTCPGETLDLDEIRCEVLALRRRRARVVATNSAVIDPLGCGENGVNPEAGIEASRRGRTFSARVGGQHRALCVGIDDYADAPLTGCVRDAERWAALFRMHGFQVETLLNRDA